MERKRAAMIDNVSRFLSVLAFLAGVGGLGSSYFLYQENLSLRDELTKRIDAAGISDDDVKKFNTEWEGKLSTALGDFNDALAGFKDDANSALDKDDKARDARGRIFNEVVDQLRKDRVDVEEIVSRRLAEVAPAPQLLLAESRMKSEDGVSRIPVTNIGNGAAKIESAVFRPRVDGQFRLDRQLESEFDINRLVIEFSPNDNKAKTVGRHDDYQRNYLVPTKAILPNQTVAVSIEIKNSEHVNWGWHGDLELKYADGETLSIPNIDAVFVPDDEDAL